MAGRYDMEVDQGATYSITATYRNPDLTLIDLTGYSARMQIRTGYNDPAFVLELNTTNGGIVLGGALGTVTINITPAQSSAIPITSTVGIPPYQNFVYDIELTKTSDGSVRKFLVGFVKLNKEVTV